MEFTSNGISGRSERREIEGRIESQFLIDYCTYSFELNSVREMGYNGTPGTMGHHQIRQLADEVLAANNVWRTLTRIAVPDTY